jgi:hypothetical protein
MKTKTRFAASSAAVVLFVSGVLGAEGGCAGGKVDLGHDNGQENTNLSRGDIDSGTGLCGNAACGTGELCCAGTDLYCSPTCMKVDRCPVLGRPCYEPDSGGGEGGAVSNLHWYTTCGTPVCSGPDDGGPVSYSQEGQPCTKKGDTIAMQNPCGIELVCDDHDPKVGGCPKSSRDFKQDIHYLSEQDLERLHDETLRTKLATYKYKSTIADPDPTHLGFIIEDQPQSLAIDRKHTGVDLYGYVSMAVATMQVQEREIAQLKKEVEVLRATSKACAPKR